MVMFLLEWYIPDVFHKQIEELICIPISVESIQMYDYHEYQWNEYKLLHHTCSIKNIHSSRAWLKNHAPYRCG